MDAKELELLESQIKESILSSEDVKSFNDKVMLTTIDAMKINEIDTSIVSNIIGETKQKIDASKFYIEEPPITSLGYHEKEKVWFMTADYKKSSSFADHTFSALSIENTDCKNHILKALGRTGADVTSFHYLGFSIKMAGVSTSKYFQDTCTIQLSDIDFSQYTITTFLSRDEMIASDTIIADLGTLTAIKIGDHFYQYKDTRSGSNHRLEIAALHGINSMNIYSCLEEMQMYNPKFYIMLDATTLEKKAVSEYSIEDLAGGTVAYWSKEFLKLIKTYWYGQNQNNDYAATYYTLGEIAKGTFLGTIYAKCGNQWINVNKLMIAMNKAESDLSYDIASVFNIQSFNDLDDKKAALESKALLAYFDDRWDIQKSLFGKSSDALKDWTVTLGDCTFYVPPTSIKLTSNTTSDRLRLARANGSAVKTRTDSERYMELSLFFSGHQQINGMKINSTLPNKKEIDYYVNGLRSLIAQFKFCPFVPIENDYINKVLNIDAVSYQGIQITTIPGYPRLICATITLQEFNYGVYMPEIPFDPTFEEDINYFASTISFPTMRWYYQRCIHLGNEISQYDFHSDKFNEIALTGKTFLAPFDFSNQNITFYVPNEDDLKVLLEAKMAQIKARGKVSATLGSLDSENRRVLKQLGSVFEQIVKLNSSDFLTMSKDIEKTIKNLSKYHMSPYAVLNAVDKKIVNIVSYVDTFLRNYAESNYTIASTEKVTGISSDSKPIYGIKITFDFAINSLTQIDSLRSLIATNTKIEQKDVLNEYALTIYFDDFTHSDGYKILDYCASQSLGDANSANDIGEELEEAVDDLTSTISFDPVVLANVTIVSVGAYTGNTTSRINLLSQEGYAQQFIGGQDTVYEFVLETTDEVDVQKIQALPKFSSLQMKKYHAIMTCWPLKIDSAITKFLGTTDVSFEHVSIDTVPNYPGVYRITLRLISVNRTLRNAEALKRVESKNKEYLEANGGYNNENNANAYCIKSYFDIQNFFADAEIYPDLELPLIDEIEATGLYYLKLPNDTNRIFVDPDFYFVYAHVMMSEVYREAVIAGYNEAHAGEKIPYSFKGVFQDEYKVNNEKYIGVNITPNNENARKINNEITIRNKAAATNTNNKQEDSIAKAEKSTQEKPKNIIDIIDNSQIIDIWNVCAKIKPLFMEKKYKNIIETRTSSTVRHVKGDDVLFDDVIANTKAAIESIDNYLKTGINPAYVTGTEILDTINQVIHTMQTEMATQAVASIPGLSATQTAKTAIALYEYLFGSITPSGLMACIEREFDHSCVHNAFRLTGLNSVQKWFGNCKEDLCHLIYAAACASTGIEDYSGKKGSTLWQPRNVGISYCVGADSSKKKSQSIQECIKTGTEFSIYGIKMYSLEELVKMTGESITVKSGSTINETMYLLDPYYRYADVETVETYKRSCLTNENFATVAFFRIMMYWYKKLLEHHCFPNVILDILKEKAVAELSALEIENNLRSGVKSTVEGSPVLTDAEKQKVESSQKKIDAYKDFIKDEDRPTDMGKIFAAVTLAITDCNDEIFTAMNRSDYEYLNAITLKCLNSSTLPNHTKSYTRLRRLLNALVGVGIVHTKEKSFADTSNFPTSYYERIKEDQKYIEAADDPSQFIYHSFHDMLCHDVRGRMLRAFPTFYVVFVDEGREISRWKLHDNFYTINAISQITITKSREIPADVANITITNMFNTMAEEDDYGELNHYNYNLTESFMSIFTPERTYAKEEAKRNEYEKPYSRSRIRSGARIHVRMGYGSNASTLPVVFNGTVTEVGVNNTVEIVAQGDGIELMNPILDNSEEYAQEFLNKDAPPMIRLLTDLLSKSKSPREILNYIVTTKGSWWAKLARNITKGTMCNNSPYGLAHFGDPDFDAILESGEPTQNIFEAMSKPCWGNENRLKDNQNYQEKDAIQISFKVPGKTLWDILNICASVSPDFIVGVVPFGMRSTIFHGLPRFYYAYDYFKDTDDIIKEKRKPFQQYHIYSSDTDIIANNINTSSKYVNTVAVGKYRTVMGEASTIPIYADFDIYPENQKTMIVDTQLHTNVKESVFNKFADNKGFCVSQRVNAINSAKNTLKKSIGSMYQGDLIVMGDTTVKPHDRIIITDEYNYMNGQATVREVVTTFNTDVGFISSIYPDCIATVDDAYEFAVHASVGKIVLQSTVMGSAIKFGSNLTMNGIKSIFKTPVLKHLGVIKKSASVKKFIDTMKKVKMLNKTASGARVLTGAAAGIFTGGIGYLVMIALQFIVGSLIGAKLKDFLSSVQAVTVFPLKRYDKAYVAGLDGSLGMIVGSPTYMKQGQLDKVLAQTFGSGKKEGIFKIIAPLAAVMLPTDEDTTLMADRLSKNGGIEKDTENTTQNALLKVRQILHRGDSAYDLYSNILLKPRASSKEDYLVSMQNFSIKTENSMLEDTNLKKHLRLISSGETIRYYKDKRFFKIVQEEAQLSNKLTTKTFTFNDGGEKTTIVGYKIKQSSYTYPILQTEALLVLVDIINRTYYNIPDDIRRDKEKMKYLSVFLKSALYVGGDSMNTCGTSFALSCVSGLKKNYTLEAMTLAKEQILQELKAKQEKLGITDGIENISMNFDKEKTSILFVNIKLENKNNPNGRQS